MTQPMDILQDHPVRKSGRQKELFRKDVQSYLERLGYSVTVEKGSFGARNLLAGDPEHARYLVTAHYDTCAVLPFPNLVTPCNFWPFLAYQLFTVLYLMVPAFLLGLVDGILLRDANWGSAIAGVAVYVFLLLCFVGPANKQNANDNTSGVVTLLEIARTLPENQRNKVCFVLFDLEEVGLFGSASYRKTHRKASSSQMVLNLDCVGDGDHIRLFPTRKLKKDRKKLTALYKACGYFGSKDIQVHEKGFSFYPSDQKQFPYGVGIAALRKSRFGLYVGRIHTKKDTILEESNVNILRAALTNYICRDAVQ